jgi:tetratricopeptide (TPR) repeat protein
LRLTTLLTAVGTLCGEWYGSPACGAIQEPAQDNYHFERADYGLRPDLGFAKATELLNNAIENEAPESIIAKLRFEQALMAHKCRRNDLPAKDFTVIAAIQPIIDDPSSLLSDIELSKVYLNAVQLYCSSLYRESSGPVDPAAVVHKAIDNINNAAALTERERFLVSATFLHFGSTLAQDAKDYQKALEWLDPLVGSIDRFVQDETGTEILESVLRTQTFYYLELGQFDEASELLDFAIETIHGSTELAESAKLLTVSQLVANLMPRMAQHPAEGIAARWWKFSQELLVELDGYVGTRQTEVLAAGINLRQMLVEFLRDRDLDESIALVAQSRERFVLHPALVGEVNTAVDDTIQMHIRVELFLRGQDDPRVSMLRQQRDEFLSSLEQTGLAPEHVTYYRKLLASFDSKQ